jgi:hypothetical protein
MASIFDDLEVSWKEGKKERKERHVRLECPPKKQKGVQEEATMRHGTKNAKNAWGPVRFARAANCQRTDGEDCATTAALCQTCEYSLLS